MKKILLTACVLLAVSAPAFADKIKYYQDPVYQRLNAGDAHPMNDLISLAENDDIRAQFILGDLYAKGKGGLSKNEKKASYWFERSAKHGYAPSFVRLAALAKRQKAPVEAYTWYSLAIDSFGSGNDQKYAVKARNDLVSAAKMTKDEIKEAKNAVNAWKTMKVKEDRELRDAKKTAKEDAILEKPVKKKKERPVNE